MLDAETILKVIQTIPGLAGVIKVLKRDGKPFVSIKHLVVKSDFVVKQLLNGHFQTFYEQLHARRVYMQNNEVLNYLKAIYRDHVSQNRYNNWDETPVSALRDPNLSTYERTTDIHELIELSQKHDPIITGRIIANLTKNNKTVHPGDFCRISYFDEGCGEEVAEMIEFRPLWLVLLWIENLSDGPIDVGDYSGNMYYPNLELDYRGLSFSEGENYRRDIPFNILQKEESILIPEFILLAPIEPYPTHNAKEIKCDSYEDWLDLLYAFTPSQIEKGFHLIGPSLTVAQIGFANITEEVHEFDITNTLTVSDLIEVGSCPYVIGYRGGKIQYLKDVLSNGPEKIDIQSFDYIIIAEIEDEITVLDELSVGDTMSQTTLVRNRTLKKGGFITIDNVKERNAILIIRGRYFARNDNLPNKHVLVWKYQNLRRFVSQLAYRGAPPT